MFYIFWGNAFAFAIHTGGTIGNGDYPLRKVVRASNAAPAYFAPETITIAEKPDHRPTTGLFVDGGVRLFNYPALQTFMDATIAWGAGSPFVDRT